MSEVIKIRITFVFRLVDLEHWMMSKLRPLKVEEVQAVQGLLRMLTWKMVLAFLCGMRSNHVVMEWVKPAGCSYRYG